MTNGRGHLHHRKHHHAHVCQRRRRSRRFHVRPEALGASFHSFDVPIAGLTATPGLEQPGAQQPAADPPGSNLNPAKSAPIKAWAEAANAARERRLEAGRAGLHACLATLLLILLSLALAQSWEKLGKVMEQFWYR